jgi:FkbM family methyltransferase
MSPAEFVIRGIGKFEFSRRYFQSVCRKSLANSKSRIRLNNVYNKLSYRDRIFFHYLFARIFRNVDAPQISTQWNLRFLKTNIYMPLRRETLWLDWDLAVSILGHDIEIKSFYERLLSSEKKPTCFFDVGANYGTHSLLFLSQGVRTVTFEPNPECKPIFKAMLELNGLKGQLENCAIGNENSNATLIFPKEDTWNGSIQKDYQHDLDKLNDLMSIDVEVMTLDNYVSKNGIKPDIVKIDTEGYELNVLKGAKFILQNYKPILVFESNKSEERDALFNELESDSYNIFEIGDYFNFTKNHLTKEEFLKSRSTNFVSTYIL